MGWSTPQLAELAGTSLRTVRHYHEVGLLDAPTDLPPEMAVAPDGPRLLYRRSSPATIQRSNISEP